MDKLFIEKRKDTLEIDCNNESGLITMKGTSYPEDAVKFFEPVFNWLEDYIEKSPAEIKMELEISYLNTSSSKCMLDILEILEEYHEEGGNVKIVWFYKKKDKDMYETGEEFKEDMELPFELIAN